MATSEDPARGCALIDNLRESVEAGGFRVVQIRLDGGSQLRVMIDLPTGGISVLDCQRASRLVAAALEALGRDPGSFAIDVESPGIDRPLTSPEDFVRYRGERVGVVLREPDSVSGRRKYTGVMTAYDEERGCIKVAVLDGEAMEFAVAAMKSVRLSPDPDKLFGKANHEKRQKGKGQGKRDRR